MGALDASFRDRRIGRLASQSIVCADRFWSLDSTDDAGWGMEAAAAAVIPSSPSARPFCIANFIRIRG